MESSREPISVRIARLNNLFLGRACAGNVHYLGREGLMDALILLYDECNNDVLKKDRNIAIFIEKYRSVVSELRCLRVNILDFEVKKVIGRGHFGEVQVVREKLTGDVYAMKTLRKSDTLSQQAVAFYEEERDIMAHASSPWLTTLQYAFQDMHNLYLVMEFHPGGDLLALLDRFDGCLEEDMAKFYLAELTLSIHSLHLMGYVHRDIKPDNILIDRCGHLKLADFGSAAKLTAAGVVMSQMPVGTPDYIAPEVLESMEASFGNTKMKNQSVYGVECDYWSLGVVAYEMVFGQTPFSGDQLTSTFYNIMNYKSTLQFPESCGVSQSYCDMVRGLLVDATSRLGHEQLLKHAFFCSVDWNTLREGIPPFVPVVNGTDDTSNFVEFEREPPAPSIENFKSKKEFSGNNLPFVGFTYVHDMDVISENKDTVNISPKRKNNLEERVGQYKGEIENLQRRICELEHGDERRKREVDVLEKKLVQKCQQLETVKAAKENLECKCEQLKNEKVNMLQTMEREYKNLRGTEMTVFAQIRLSKATWKKEHQQEIIELEKRVETQEQHIVELCTINNNLSSKVDRQTEELKSSYSELEMLKKEVQENQDKLAQARKKNRHSVVVVETKLERIAADSQSHLVTLQSQLADEIRLRFELQEKLRESEGNNAQKEAEISALKERESSQAAEMRSELESFRLQYAGLQKQVDFLREEIDSAFKDLESSKKAVVFELGENLRREKQDCQELRIQLMKVEGELSESIMSQENTLAIREAEHETQVAMLETEIKQAAADKMKLQQRMQEALDKEEEDNRKLETLEGLLKRLEQGLKHLEEENLKLKALNKCTEDVSNHSGLAEELEKQKVILLSQVEKLELQVQKLNEMSILDKQAARTSQHQLWKKEKELSDAKIDVRIAQREAKTAEDQLRALQEEKQKWGEKLQAEINAHAKQLQGECDKVDQLNQQVMALSAELQDMKEKEETARKQIDMGRDLLTQKMVELDSSKITARTLQHELDMAHKQLKVFEQQVTDLQMEAKRLSETISHTREDKLKLETELEDQRRRNNSLELNNNCLKELCTVHDDELEDAEKLIKSHEEKEAVFKQEKKSLQAEIESLQQKFQKACQDLNEEKSLRIRAESRIQSLEKELQAHVEDAAVLQSQIEDYRSLGDAQTQQVTELEDRHCTAELELRNMQRQLQASQDECAALKEELTQYLTQINSVKESNFKLNRDVEDYSDQIQQLKIKYSDLEATLTELQAFYKQREIKSEATVQQQTKLIDYLQKRIEDANKKNSKKTLTDKLFGNRQKEHMSLLAAAPSGKVMHIASYGYQQTNNKSFVEPMAVWPTHSMVDTDSGRACVSAMSPITSLSKNALTHLVQSPGSQTPGCFARQPSLQRMHHNIPHRFDQKLCVRPIKCAACLDSIHFGHYAFICQECDITAHPKCSLVLPSTCGIPSGFARHFSQSWKISQVDSDVTVSSQSAESRAQSYKPEGYVKIPKRGRSCWERRYLRLEGTELQIFDHEPTTEMKSPSQKFLVCRPEGTTSILSSVPYSEVVNTAKSDLPFIFKVEVSPRTTCWPGSSLLVMALSFSEKQSWVSALEAVVQGHNTSIMEVDPRQPVRYQGSRLLHLDRPGGLDLNCCLQLSPEILLLGAEEGLFSYRLKEKNAKPVKIQGLTHVHQMSMLPLLNCIIILAGEDRNLMQCDLRMVRISAEAAECVKPSIIAHSVLPAAGSDSVSCCLVFAAATTKDGDEQTHAILCAATEKRILLLRWNVLQNVFQLTKTLDTKESCSCIHFARHSVIVGCNRFFEIDNHDFSMEEFLDPSDKSLAHVIFGAHQLHIYPVAVLDVTRSRMVEPEYLLCFNVFGVFVDKYGQRTRPDDIKWSHLPLGFEYRKPYLFILHFSSVEIMKLSDSSFTRSQDDSSATVNYPEQTYIELNNPRFLGPAVGQGPAMYVGHCTQMNIEILIVEGALACKEDSSFSEGSSDVATERDGADLNSCAGSDFSFTSSLAQSLENITDSIQSGDCESIVLNNQHRKVHFDGV